MILCFFLRRNPFVTLKQTEIFFFSGVVSTDQAEICKRIRDVDIKAVTVTHNMKEKQQKYSQHAEKLKTSVREMTKNLSKCHLLLNENLEQLETLNNLLPKDDRLEPFVWTTG